MDASWWRERKVYSTFIHKIHFVDVGRRKMKLLIAMNNFLYLKYKIIFYIYFCAVITKMLKTSDLLGLLSPLTNRIYFVILNFLCF